MAASDNQLLHDSIEQLLAPLGLGLTWADGTWWLCRKKDSSMLADMETIDGVSIVGYHKLDALRDDLCSEISKILVDDQCVANPYLGCRSLEEMLVRCVLLGA